METRMLALLVAVTAGALCAATVARILIAFVRRTRRTGAVLMRTTPQNGPVAMLFGASRIFYPLAGRLVRIPSVKRLCRTLVVMDASAFVTEEGQRQVCAALCALSCIVGVVAALFSRSFLCGAALVAAVWMAAGLAAEHAFDRRREAMREAVPEALHSIGTCFRSGFSIRQAFDYVQHETPGPLGSLFSHASHELSTGVGVDQALEHLRVSSDIAELSFVSVALAVQHRAGGSMRQVIDAACDSLESEISLKRSLRVHTAQAKLSARVVSMVTVILVVVLSLLSEDFLGPFLAGPLGVVLLVSAIAMQVAGIVIVQRMLHVEVD